MSQSIWAYAVLLGVCLAVAGSAGAAAAPKGPPDERAKDVAAAAPGAKFVPNELIVRFREGVAPARREAALAAVGARLEETLALPRLVLASLPAGVTVPVAEAALERLPDVLYAEPNFIYRASVMPNDPRFPELWGLHQGSDVDIDAPEAWDFTTGSRDVVVAVIDTGVAAGHPELAPNMWRNPGETGGGKESNGIDDDGNGYVDDFRGWDFVNDDNNPFDDQGHGTHVAGTIGAVGNNGAGIAGVNWSVSIMALKFLGADGGGSTADAIDAIIYAGANGAHVVNNSWGGGPFSQALLDAINAAPNTLFAHAAGNEARNNDTTPQYPCNYATANGVCVAATDRNDQLASFSNFGATTVHLAAPGVGILSTVPSFQTLFTEGWETDIAGRWATGGTNNTWARTTEAKSAGSYSATDSPGANYLNNTNSWIAKVTSVSLAGRGACVLVYDLRLASEFGFDGLLVEASTNGTTWTILDGWSGSTGGAFFELSSSLGAFDGQSSVFVRFRFVSDASITFDGAHVDEVELRCADPTAAAYAIFNGTSMAAPHVAGVAALVWAKTAWASVAEVRAAIVAGGDLVGALAGKVATGRRLNANGTLALIPRFTDVPTTNPFYADIERLFVRRITTGCGTNALGRLIFCPTDSVTRQQMAAFLIRALGLGELDRATPTFADVPKTNPFYGYVERLFETGITRGCGTNASGQLIFCPGEFVPRQQMAAFLIRAKGLDPLDREVPTFADVPKENPFYADIERLFESGITRGCGTNASGQLIFCPGEFVPRQQMAAFLIRAFP